MEIHPFSCRQRSHSIFTHQDKEDDTEDSGPLLAGGYNRGDAVTASRDLRHFLLENGMISAVGACMWGGNPYLPQTNRESFGGDKKFSIRNSFFLWLGDCLVLHPLNKSFTQVMKSKHLSFLFNLTGDFKCMSLVEAFRPASYCAFRIFCVGEIDSCFHQHIGWRQPKYSATLSQEAL